MPADIPAISPQVEFDRSVMAQGDRFVAEHLAACCAELTILYDSGILPDGYLRALATIYRSIDAAHALELALGAVSRAAVRQLAADAAPAPTAETGR